MTLPEPYADITWPTGDSFLVTIYRGKTAPGTRGHYFWHVTSTANGKTVADSGQGYTRRRSAVRAARRLWPVTE